MQSPSVHCTCEDVYQTKYVQSKRLLNFGKYGYGGHITYQSDEGHIERFAFDVCMSSIPIFTKIKQPFALHIFCLVNGFASTVNWKKPGLWLHDPLDQPIRGLVSNWLMLPKHLRFLNTCTWSGPICIYVCREGDRQKGVCKAGLLCPFLSGLLVVRKWSVLNTIAKMSRRCAAVALTTKANFIGFSKIRSASLLVLHFQDQQGGRGR